VCVQQFSSGDANLRSAACSAIAQLLSDGPSYTKTRTSTNASSPPNSHAMEKRTISQLLIESGVIKRLLALLYDTNISVCVNAAGALRYACCYCFLLCHSTYETCFS